MSQSRLFRNLFWVVFAWSAVSGLEAGEDPSRIVTIGGAATEIVWALGEGDRVVAVDQSSTWPPEVRMLPQVGYVRSISPEGVLSMEPDLVVATGALGPPPARKMMDRLSVPVVWLPDPDSPEDLRISIDRVAAALGQEERGRQLWSRVKRQLRAVSRSSGAEGDKPQVLFLLEPPGVDSGGMAGGAGSRADSLIGLAGGRNAAGEFSGFQPISREGLLRMNPDVILVAESEGHGGSPAEIQALRESPVLAAVAAVRGNAVYGVPLDDLAFGPRLGEVVQRWADRIQQGSSDEDR